MVEKHLHIISFDVPFPANYGGVIDVFYKIKSLHKHGIKIHLHCFEYGRKKAEELNKYCYKVNYYKRHTGFAKQLSTTPYIIRSRTNIELINNLLRDQYPIFCEGMHSCSIVTNPKFKERKIIYRAANVEHHYYNGLANSEKNIFKKLYFKLEASKLLKWEEQLSSTDIILSISKTDQKHYQQIFPNKKVENIFAYFQQDENLIPNFENTEKYILFHGNLSVHENNETALYITNELSQKTNNKFIIAGKNPGSELTNKCNSTNNVNIIANPTNKEMYSLIQKAHINLLLTNQPTGLKLKLLNSLYSGKHCLVNNNMLSGSDLQNIVDIGNTTTELLHSITILMQKEFTLQNYEERKKQIPKEFDNDYKSKKIIKLLGY